MKRFFTVLLVQAMTYCSCFSQQPVEMDLWPDGAPESNSLSKNEKGDGYSTAKLYVYRPDKQKNTRAAVVICPGGGYAGLAMNHEGHDYARWLINNGITAVILKYRLPDKNHFIPLKDAQRALRTVRSKAKEWDIDPAKLGISGFSAGGHLASTAATHFDAGNASAADPLDRLSCRPDFAILFYPVITMKEAFTHMGSRRNLMGDGYNAELVTLYSNEEQVTAQTPPAFLITSDDDKAVPPRNSIEFYSALKRNNIPAVLYVIPDGGHGWGTSPEKSQYLEWSVPLKAWLTKILK
ncbi:MAG: alpha/beta hydrolase [Bacteroidales bacterium]|jgi:acetyl esterase/lipase|nr:alpha/beta hydrolase [Bacteroidales bacterium]